MRRGSLDDLRALGNRVRREGWCPHCAGRLRLTTEEMQALARERAGLVSTVYINSERETPVTIRLQGPHPVGEVLRVMIAAGRPSGMARSEYPGPLDVEAWAGSLRALVDRTH